MAQTPLERRVERLERLVEEMHSEMRRHPRRDEWRMTVGAFAADPLGKEIIDESLRLREAERQQGSP